MLKRVLCNTPEHGPYEEVRVGLGAGYGSESLSTPKLSTAHEANKELGGRERRITREKARGGHLNFIRQVNPAGLREAKTTYSE